MSEDGKLTREDHAYKKVRITPHVTVAEEKAARLYAAHMGMGWSEAINMLLALGIEHERKLDKALDEILRAVNA
jgi:hypothetical protein